MFHEHMIRRYCTKRNLYLLEENADIMPLM